MTFAEQNVVVVNQLREELDAFVLTLSGGDVRDGMKYTIEFMLSKLAQIITAVIELEARMDEAMKYDIDSQAAIVVRLEEKYGVRYVPVMAQDEVGKLGLSFPEMGIDGIEIPYYNKGEVVQRRDNKGELYRLKPGEFVIRFGKFPLIGTVEQIKNVWLYTYALSKALENPEGSEV